MDTAIRIKNSEGQAETLCSVVTPTTWECVQYDATDWEDNDDYGYVADYALPASFKRRNLFATVA